MSAPVSTLLPRAMSSSAAIASAVLGWSPVIITTSTPVARSLASAAAASGRTGSLKATSPANVRPTRRDGSSRSSPPTLRSATASTRKPRRAMRLASAVSSSVLLPSSAARSPFTQRRVQCGRIASGAPFTLNKKPDSIAPTTAWRQPGLERQRRDGATSQP
jgi:hypothetical protein